MKKRVLIADDHELMRVGIRTLIGTHFTICGEVSNGKQAVAKTIEMKPDVVILDVTLPILSGLDAARQIRAATPATKILLLSMHHSAKLEEEAKAAGADALLSKGAVAGQLIKVVNQLTGIDGRHEAR